MIAIRIRSACVRTQRLIHRQPQFCSPHVWPTTTRLFSGTVPGSDHDTQGKNFGTKKDAPHALTVKKKIDFKKKALEIGGMVWSGTKTAVFVIGDHIFHPSKIPISARHVWKVAKEEAMHYWVSDLHVMHVHISNLLFPYM
jgi:hypothetical protein